MTFMFLLFTIVIHGQNPYDVKNINPLLRINANAVVRTDAQVVEIENTDKLRYRKEYAVTVFNRKANNLLRFYGWYKEGSSKIKNIKILIYDKNGSLIREVDKDELLDTRYYNGVSMIHDGRVVTFDYTPSTYPVTMYFSYEYETRSTINLPRWIPIPGFHVAVEKASFHIINHTDSKLFDEAINTEHINIQKKASNYFECENLFPIPKESLSPPFGELRPIVFFRLTEFEFEGYKGKADSWEELGLWFYHELYKDRDDMEAINPYEIFGDKLGEDMSDREKIAHLYKYVQKQTRYINISLDEGGYQPMKTSEVHRTKYGDCKALSFYLHSLLRQVGIPSDLVVVFANAHDQISLTDKFTAVQGNHLIVRVPLPEDTIWLDCTSNDAPFNYLGSFTDNRRVLCFNDQKSFLSHTPLYNEEKDITDSLSASVRINNNLMLNGVLIKKHRKLDYEQVKFNTKTKSAASEDLSEDIFTKANSFKTENVQYLEAAEKGAILLNCAFNSDKYGERAGKYFLLPLALDRLDLPKLKKVKTRRHPIKIPRSKASTSSIQYDLPAHFRLFETFDDFELKSEFGTYKITVKMDNEILIIDRYLLINAGTYKPERYRDFRKFINQIKKKESSMLTFITQS